MEPINSFDEYKSNKTLILATERGLEIIGEALNRVLKSEPHLPISNSRKIVNLRNIIIHQYYEVEYNRVWSIMKNVLPVLEKEIKEILEVYEKKLELKEL
jgi:uncharacterized protein with HEPN domain